MWAEVLKLMSQEKHAEPFTELAKTFPKCNENIVNTLYKSENDREKCADTEVKTDISPGKEQVIYYVSAYIVYSLSKGLTRLIKVNTSNISARTVLQFLNFVNANHSAHL